MNHPLPVVSQNRRRGSSFSMVSSILVVLIGLICTVQVLLFNPSYLSPLLVSSSPSAPRWAYVFLLADCDPRNPTYRGMLYNILAATFVLKVHQSRSDVVVLIQMTVTGSLLPEETLLQQMKIQFRYLPPPDHPLTFYELVMAKFHVLTMTEYSKIIFLDGDVLPLCNLDFLMELSTKGRLGDTVLHAMYEDPVNAGLFLITPRADDDSLATWNENIGHRPPVDFRLWDGKSQSGWDFYCGDSDQGFLLYRALFLESRSVSLIVGPAVEQYAAEPQITTHDQRQRQRQPAMVESTEFLSDYSCSKGSWAVNSNPLAAQWPFYRDFFHMVGYSKAWETPPKNITHPENSRDYWYSVFQQVVDQIDHNHKIIPYPLETLSNTLGKPKLRGDLIFTLPQAVV